MKLTLEMSEKKDKRVVIETSWDHLTHHAVLEELVLPAMRAYGYVLDDYELVPKEDND